ncbi:MAG: DNA primase [Arcobacter sp.]|nr:MAG: DNA primase [Arcobacter sp.]
MDGDGCYSRNTYDTISSTLANEVLDLAISLEKLPACRISKEHTDKTGLTHKKSYTLYFKKLESLNSFYEEIEGVKYLFTKVKKIESTPYEDLVYDITVLDKSQTFLSKHFAVGNCGVTGDPIRFVMEYEKLNYPEALEKLAEYYNFSLQYTQGGQKKTDTRLMEKVNDWYKTLLDSNQTALAYLKDRGIFESSIEKFGIGYAPASKETITYIKSHMFDINEAIDLGVLGRGENNIYARFIERITFPIQSANGSMVGFGGRTITGHQAKYVNSPQTKIFNKSRLLYAYNHAKESIYKHKEVIVTEGYLDVVMLHQAGFTNAVATLGTALTPDHLPLIRKGEPKIIMAYDGDNAGLNAAIKASKLVSAAGMDGGVVIFGDGLDPADMVRNGQIEELNRLLRHPKPFIEFVLEQSVHAFDMNNPKAKEEALHSGIAYLKTLSPLLQEEYRPYLAALLNVNKAVVRLAKAPQNRQIPQLNPLSHEDIWELSLIKTILESPQLIENILDFIDPSQLHIHANEFSLALNNEHEHPQLVKTMLNDSIKVFKEEDLKNELLFFLRNYYAKELRKVKSQKDISFEQKTFTIRQYTEKINKLRRGELVPFKA